MENQNKYGVWSFLGRGYSPESYRELGIRANRGIEFFLSSVAPSLVDDSISVTTLDEWVAENDALLTELVRDLQTYINQFAPRSLPAHDRRQILAKDAAEGLRFADSEKPLGYKSTFVIPMFAHDIGRLAEGLFHHHDNKHANWIPHAKLSYLMLHDILRQDKYRDMPSELKNHYLYAVAAHSGDNAKTFMGRAVQTCDRMQLIGAEGLFRAVGYSVCLLGADIHYPHEDNFKANLPDMNDHRSVLSILEYFARNMRETIGGEGHQTYQRSVAAENIALLMKACGDNGVLWQTMFAPECGVEARYGPLKSKITDDDVLAQAQKIYDRFPTSGNAISAFDLTTKIQMCLEGIKGAAALDNAMKQNLTNAVARMSDAERMAINAAVDMADRLRAASDKTDAELSLRIMNDAAAPSYYRAIAAMSLKSLPNLAVADTYVPAPETKASTPWGGVAPAP